MSTPKPSELTLPCWFLAELIGVSSPNEVAFGRDVVAALERVAPELVPRVRVHPLEALIARGPGGLEALSARYAAASGDDARSVVLSAFIEVLERHRPLDAAAPFLERALAQASSARVASLAARALAASGCAPFLEHQRRMLGSRRPTEVSLAARLLGYGRHVPAVPMLLDALRPQNTMAAGTLIWALGEIGSPRAVAKLHTILAQFGMSEAVIEALGKIGSRVSVARLFPYLLEGEPGQRERAAEALARISRKNDGSLGDPALDASVRATLDKVVDVDSSHRVRFHAMLALARLGGRLAPERILAALGGRLSDRRLAGPDGIRTVVQAPLE